jgi:hypothetical protein
MPQTEPPDALHQQELHEALDAELRRLPEKYRAPLVLCFLEGKTNEQAALELGWPAGTVKNRMLRGRDILRGRLARHGVALATGLIAPLTAPEPVSAALVTKTLNTAVLYTAGQAVAAPVAALTEGVLRTMWVTKLKIAAIVLVTLAPFAGAGLLIYSSSAAEQPTAPAAQTPAIAKAEPAADKDYDKDRLSLAEFDKLHKQLTAREGWLKIPWKTSLQEARAVAAREKKPLFLGMVDGDTLSLC